MHTHTNYWPSHSSKVMRAETGVALTIVRVSISPPPFLALRKWMKSLSFSLPSSMSAGRPLTLTVRLGAAIYWGKHDHCYGRGGCGLGAVIWVQIRIQPTKDSLGESIHLILRPQAFIWKRAESYAVSPTTICCKESAFQLRLFVFLHFRRCITLKKYFTLLAL